MPNNPSAHGSVPRQVAIVGLNRETAELLPGLFEAKGIQVIKVLNPDLEDVGRLSALPNLEIIIDTTRSQSVAARLRRLPMRKVEILSGLGARLLFCSTHAQRRLDDVREAVGSGRGKAETLRAILSTAVKAAGADTGSLMLLDASRRQLTIACAVGLDDQVVLSAVQRLGQGISGRTAESRETLLLNGPVNRAAFAADYRSESIVSSICCPILGEPEGREALGVINIASRDATRMFDEGDTAFLEDLARLAADVILNAREAEPGQGAAQVPTLLLSVREILSMPYRFEERLNLLLMKMANAFGANLCSYYEYCPEDGVFVARASSAAGINLLKEKPRFLDEFFAQRVLKTDNTFCVNAAGKGPRDKKWYLMQPIRSGGSLTGTLFVHLHSEKNALREETALLRRVGDLLAHEVGRNREMEAVKVSSLKHSAIAQFAYDIDSAVSLEELARMAVSNVGLILEAETCVLRLRNAPDEDLRAIETRSGKNPAWLKDILALDELIVADLGPGRGAALYPDLRESPYNLDLLGSETALVAAMEIDGVVVGTVSLYDKKSADLAGSRSFSESDRDLMLDFARRTATGLKRFYPFPTPASWSPIPAAAE